MAHFFKKSCPCLQGTPKWTDQIYKNWATVVEQLEQDSRPTSEDPGSNKEKWAHLESDDGI